MNNTDYFVTMATVSGWAILGSKRTFSPVDVLEAGKMGACRHLCDFIPTRARSIY